MLLAEARLKFGKLSDVLSMLRWALDSVTELGIGFCVPELYRLKGVCLLQLDSTNEKAAMGSLQMALDVAKQQKATLFELKAAIDLAKAGSSLAQPESYLQPLRDLCANLPEAFDAPLLAEAKRLL